MLGFTGDDISVESSEKLGEDEVAAIVDDNKSTLLLEVKDVAVGE